MRPSTETTELWAWRYDHARDEYVAGRMSSDLFKAMLYRLGFRGQEIDREERLHRPSTKGS